MTKINCPQEFNNIHKKYFPEVEKFNLTALQAALEDALNLNKQSCKDSIPERINIINYSTAGTCNDRPINEPTKLAMGWLDFIAENGWFDGTKQISESGLLPSCTFPVALTNAARHGHNNVICYFMKYEVHSNLPNRYAANEKALDVAISNNHVDTTELLLQANDFTADEVVYYKAKILNNPLFNDNSANLLELLKAPAIPYASSTACNLLLGDANESSSEEL
jgi:hypothetical protein